METKQLSTDRPISIDYIFKTNITDYSQVGKSNCQVTITGNWNPLPVTTGTIELTENSFTGAGGFAWETQIIATVPGHDENTPGNLRELCGRQVMLRITYRSGKIKIIGNSDRCPRLYLDIRSGITTKRTLNCKYLHTGPNLWLTETGSGGTGV